MDPLEHTEKYRGFQISVDVTQVREHAWIWGYSIDDGKGKSAFSNSKRALASADAAMRRGILAARARVEELIG